MAKKEITEAQLRAANKAGYSTQQIAGELNKYEKRTGNDAVYTGAMPGDPKPVQTPVQTTPVATTPTVQPVQTNPNTDTIDTSTGKPVSESPEQAQYNILPESVTGVKPYVAPSVQAKIDAKKTPVATEAPAPVETTPESTVEPVKAETVDTVKTEVKGETITPEVSDLEKQAQATGIQYTMENGQPVYNATTKEDAMKVLQMGGKLAGETKMGAVAQATLNKVRGFAQMTDQQLASNISLGKVSSKELELLNQINPNLVAKAQEFSKKKVITNTTNEVQAVNDSIINGSEYDGVSTPLKELLTKLATIDADQRSPAEMKAQYEADHPEMVTARDTINTLQTQKREVERAKRDLWDDYKAKHSSMPISMILAGYNIASKSLDDQMYSINDNLNTEISNYNSYLDEMKTEMDWEIGQQGKKEDRLWQMYGVTRQEEVRAEDIEREDMRLEQSIQLEEARYQRDIERDDMKSAEARKQKIEDMKMDMNMNIETGLLNMGVNPEGMTPEETRTTYAKAIGKQILESKVIPTKWEKTTVDGVEVFYDPVTNTTRSPSELRGVIFGDTPGNSDVGALALLPGQDLLAVPDGQIVETRLKEVSPQNAKIRGKECAEYVNDVFQQSLFGNSLNDKLRVAKEKNGMVGSAAVWSPSGSGEYGHCGIIVDEDENNWYIKSSNLKAGTVTTDKVPKSSIKGYYTTPEVKAYQPQQIEKVSDLTLSDISTFNNSTYKPQAEKDKGVKQKYQTFLEEKSTIMKDKQADIYDIMEFSQGGKDLTDSDSKTITKFSQALDQIDGIQKQVKDMKTGPILGRLKEMNPYDTKAQTLSAALNALIPNLARGVYGEVGVLTDNDIRQYAKTIPNLKQTNDVNNAVLALTLETIAGGYKRQLQTLAAAGKDVSGFAGLYESIKAQADSIKSSIPGFTSDLSQDDELEALSIR